MATEIGVQSYAELFTSWIGWTQYNNIWGILAGTGLALIPFFWIFASNTVEHYIEDPDAIRGPRPLQLKVTFEFIGAMLVVMFVMQPMITLKTDTLVYDPMCGNKASTMDNSGTTYSNTLVVMPNHDPKVPLFWYMVMGISQGVTHAAKFGIGCVPEARVVKTEMDVARISNPVLRREVLDFTDSCWGNSWAKYQTDKPNLTGITPPKDDINWIGSEIFRSLTGYYDELLAPYPVEGFPVSTDNGGFEVVGATAGIPTCKDWWEKPTVGLLDRLKLEMGSAFWTVWGALFGTAATKDELPVRRLLVNTEQVLGVGGADLSKDFGLIATGLAEGGKLLERVSYYPKMKLVIDSLPLVQALLLMMIYTIIPLIVVTGRYQFKVVMATMMVIFSVIFWGYLWEYAKYVDTFLIMALAPPDQPSVEDIHFLVDSVALGTFTMLPLLLSSGFGWAGMHAAAAIGSMLSLGTSPMDRTTSFGSLLSNAVTSRALGKKIPPAKKSAKE